jgi:hypothetical protein
MRVMPLMELSPLYLSLSLLKRTRIPSKEEQRAFLLMPEREQFHKEAFQNYVHSSSCGPLLVPFCRRSCSVCAFCRMTIIRTRRSAARDGFGTQVNHFDASDKQQISHRHLSDSRLVSQCRTQYPQNLRPPLTHSRIRGGGSNGTNPIGLGMSGQPFSPRNEMAGWTIKVHRVTRHLPRVPSSPVSGISPSNDRNVISPIVCSWSMAANQCRKVLFTFAVHFRQQARRK